MAFDYIPLWLVKYDLFFELIFFISTLILGLFSFKIYKKTKQESILLFSIAFLSIALCYLLKTSLNFINLFGLDYKHIFDFGEIYVPHIFFMIGLSIFVYVTLNISKIRVLLMIFFVSFITLWISNDKAFAFFILSTIYFIFISWHFLENYLDKKDVNSLIITFAFFCLLVGNIDFVLSSKYEIFYLVGYILELIAYSLIIINLYMVQKSE